VSGIPLPQQANLGLAGEPEDEAFAAKRLSIVHEVQPVSQYYFGGMRTGLHTTRLQ